MMLPPGSSEHSRAGRKPAVAVVQPTNGCDESKRAVFMARLAADRLLAEPDDLCL